MMAVLWNKTVLGFWAVQELALRHKAGRTGRWAEGQSRHEWGILCFFLHHINFRKLNDQWVQWDLLDLWPFEIFDGEGELEAADVVADDGGAFLAIAHLYGAQRAFQGLGLREEAVVKFDCLMHLGRQFF